jgi:hypothetical protein
MLPPHGIKKASAILDPSIGYVVHREIKNHSTKESTLLKIDATDF